MAFHDTNKIMAIILYWWSYFDIFRGPFLRTRCSLFVCFL